ncbi:phosphatase [Clostridium grantii]|uniref:Putative hydrolase n=1 Tax=Clostridium grantii DSM 8605 TaxID=1121316 RepID=A0A1M5U5N0_9CLOT|nr:phosphatase [Clostridium grantii]SHH58259.1 putative hydrolase [Clostridium grantii DSM 8605]
MKYLIDVHTHTIASGHAYSTLTENAKQASEIGLKVLGTTEHGPTMYDSPHPWYFGNYRVLPRELFGVTMLYGCEANIIKSNGELDLPLEYQKTVDILIASLHDICFEPNTRDKNTEAVLNAMENPYIDILGHLGNPTYPIWEEKIIQKAKEKNILIEFNNSSMTTSRPGSRQYCKKIAELCKENGNMVILNTDSHFNLHIGQFQQVHELMQEVEMPDDKIINIDENRIIEYLKSKGKLKDMNN